MLPSLLVILNVFFTDRTLEELRKRKLSTSVVGVNDKFASILVTPLKRNSFLSEKPGNNRLFRMTNRSSKTVTVPALRESKKTNAINIPRIADPGECENCVAQKKKANKQSTRESTKLNVFELELDW